jgi:bifunctional non-homologous end joining protein LigD
MSQSNEVLDGVTLSNLDQKLFKDAGATKRDLVLYLDSVHERMIPHLADRPLTVVRVLRGQDPFMQKNLPKYTPDWVPRAQLWAGSSQREVTYALCNDRKTLIWFANQRAIEYHPLLHKADDHRPTHIILDIDPPEGGDFSLCVKAAQLIREVMTGLGMPCLVKTSGAKGVHIFSPAPVNGSIEDIAAATRAIGARAERLDPALATTAFIKEDRAGKVFLDSTRAGGNTIVSAFSPRLRPDLPVSFPLAWDELDQITPADFTIHTVPKLLDRPDPWAGALAGPELDAALLEEGHAIPIARVQAMHEGKRRAKAKREAEAQKED